MTDHLRASDAALERLKTLHPKKIDLSLDRIARVLDAGTSETLTALLPHLLPTPPRPAS